MAWSQLQICNLALAAIGAAPIADLTDATPSGSAIAQFYPLVAAELFSTFPWYFARDTRPLNPLALTGLADGLLPQGWQFGYALPADLVGPPIRILSNGRYAEAPDTDFEIQGATVFSNRTALWCVGVFMVDEAVWPGFFVSAFSACLAADIYPILTGPGPRAAELQTLARGSPQENRIGGMVGLARRVSSQANPSRMLLRNPLVDVRMATIEVRPTGQTVP